jgi:hypothetical protein
MSIAATLYMGTNLLNSAAAFSAAAFIRYIDGSLPQPQIRKM